jgi:hypothetical protein
MVEVKADALERSFEQFDDEDDGVAELKAELEQLKAKIAAGVIAAQRPALDGVKSVEAAGFIDQYLRRGIESGLETKAVGSSSDSIGGYATAVHEAGEDFVLLERDKLRPITIPDWLPASTIAARINPGAERPGKRAVLKSAKTLKKAS